MIFKRASRTDHHDIFYFISAEMTCNNNIIVTRLTDRHLSHSSAKWGLFVIVIKSSSGAMNTR